MKTLQQITVVMILTALLAACAEDGRLTKRDVGMVAGGAAGGAAGAAIWSHDPAAQTLGTIMGVVVGAAVGGWLGGQWDDYDRRQVAHSLEYNRDNAPAQWTNPNTNQSYTVRPVNTYYDAQGAPCREFTETIYVDGKPETGRGTACRQPDGTWRIVSGQ